MRNAFKLCLLVAALVVIAIAGNLPPLAMAVVDDGDLRP